MKIANPGKCTEGGLSPGTVFSYSFHVIDRTGLKVTDEEVAEEFGRVVVLLQLARRKPLFQRLMAEASHKGLNWVEGLEHVIGSVAC